MLDAVAVFIVGSQFHLSVGVAAFGGFFEPFESFLLICDSKPEMLIKGNTEPKLRFGDAVLSGSPHAAFAFKWVLIRVSKADRILCGGVALVGGFLIPEGGFHFVLLKESARIVNASDPILRFGVAGFGFGEKCLPVVRGQHGEMKNRCQATVGGIRSLPCGQKGDNEEN